MRSPIRPAFLCCRVGRGVSGVSARAAGPAAVPFLGTRRRVDYDEAMKTIYSPAYRALLAWLREKRRAQGISMRDLAAKLGVPHSWIGKIETGERRLDVAEFVRLCEALEIDPHAGVKLLKRSTITYPLPQPDAYAEAAEEPAQS